MDSDSDLQAYINELSRKTHDLQHGDHELSDDDESELSHSSFSEIAVKKSAYTENIETQSVQSNKVKELEEKYLKRTRKSSSEQNFSLSFSDYNPEFEEDKLNTDNILTYPDEVIPDSSTKAKIRNQDAIIAETIKVSNTQNSVNDKGNSQLNGNSLKSQSIEEEVKHDSSIASIKQVERKLSDNSSLLNKGSIFYSTNDKAGKQKLQGKIIFRTRSSTSSESDTIKSDVTNSISEEILDLKQNANTKENLKAPIISKEEKYENYNYEETTFENSVDSSSIKSESKSSKSILESVSVNKSESLQSKSETKTRTSEHSSSEVIDVDDASEIEQSLREQSSTSLEESSSCSRDTGEKSENKSNKDSSSETENTSVILHDSSPSSETSSVSGSTASQSSHNLPKNSKNRHELKNIFENRIRNKKDNEHKTKKEEKTGTSKRLNKKSITSSSSSSSTVTSSSSSSTSSSFYIKMKKKKYREKKRKLKQEKELTELIMKLLIKNLPMILHRSLGLNSSPEIHHCQQRYVCHHCGRTSTGIEMTQRRIDDALRQTVDLTRQFMESHKALMETQFSHHNSNYKYTTLRNFHF